MDRKVWASTIAFAYISAQVPLLRIHRQMSQMSENDKTELSQALFKQIALSGGDERVYPESVSTFKFEEVI